NTRELRQRRQGFALLSELHRGVTTDLPPGEVFARTIASAQKMLKMDRTVVLEHDPATHLFRPVAWEGFNDGSGAGLAQVSLAFPESMLTAGSAMLATKAAAETAVMRELREKLGVPFFVCVPV